MSKEFKTSYDENTRVSLLDWRELEKSREWESLRLEHTHIPVSLASSLKGMTQLKKLSFAGSSFESEEARKAVLEAIPSTVTHLSVCSVGLSNSMASEFLAPLKGRSIELLDISDNKGLTVAGIIDLLKELALSNLRTVVMHGVPCSTAEGISLFDISRVTFELMPQGPRVSTTLTDANKEPLTQQGRFADL